MIVSVRSLPDFARYFSFRVPPVYFACRSRSVVRPKLLAAFVGVCLAGMIVSGYVFNWLQPFV